MPLPTIQGAGKSFHRCARTKKSWKREYSNPDQPVIYPDGSQAHFVVLNFEVESVDGALGLSDETSKAGYFSLAEIESMPMHDRHTDRVADALAGQAEANIR